nr:putative reverse transcriptase domain-containing protein [Tanacetum cinerariifolium]GFA27427.1 putative reverse transcriptase domain-containing protein [Tanacetum cinerariifolium]
MLDFVSGRVVIKVAQRKRVKYEAKCMDITYGFLIFSFSSFEELEKVASLLLLQLDCVDELVLDEHVGFTLPLLDRLLSKGMRTVKSIPPKCRLGFSRVLKRVLDKVICTPDDISYWEESNDNVIQSWGILGGSLQLVREALAKPSPS